jgi:hypothetical protein
MTDSVALAAANVIAGAPNATGPSVPIQADPAEARMFATLMQGQGSTSTSGPPGAYSDIAASLSAQLNDSRSFEEIRRSMLQAYDPHDPIGSMFAMTSNAMEAQALFSKLHISTSLASAATSLFGNLLKNQQ